MSEITKLYENAGIKKEVIKGCYDYYSKLGIDIWKENDCAGKNCDTCKKDKSIKRYPPFTAEKQIELIKFITTLGVCEIENWNDKGFHFAIKRERIYPTMFLSLSNINLQETLADAINNLWQDLTEEEKQQIKEILNG
jgi:hypothetical protein